MSRRLLMLLLALLLGPLASGCDRARTPSGAAPATNGVPELRLASFSPALSRMLIDLGLDTRIVGRSRFCDFLDGAIPVVGDLRAVEFETLLRVKPTHLLVQAPREGVAPALRDLADEHGWTIVSFTGIDGLDDVGRVVAALPAALAKPGSPPHERLADRAAAWAAEFDRGLTPLAAPPPIRVLLTVGTEPALAAGPDTFLGAMLVRLGAVNAVATGGWTRLGLEDVTRIAPDAIILAAPASSADARDALGPLADLDVPAVRAGRLSVLRHRDGLLPSTSLVEVAADLRTILESWSDAATETTAR